MGYLPTDVTFKKQQHPKLVEKDIKKSWDRNFDKFY